MELQCPLLDLVMDDDVKLFSTDGHVSPSDNFQPMVEFGSSLPLYGAHPLYPGQNYTSNPKSMTPHDYRAMSMPMFPDDALLDDSYPTSTSVSTNNNSQLPIDLMSSPALDHLPSTDTHTLDTPLLMPFPDTAPGTAPGTGHGTSTAATTTITTTSANSTAGSSMINFKAEDDLTPGLTPGFTPGLSPGFSIPGSIPMSTTPSRKLASPPLDPLSAPLPEQADTVLSQVPPDLLSCTTPPPSGVSSAGYDFNGRKHRKWKNRRYKCSHCSMSFLDADLHLYAEHVEHVEKTIKNGIDLTRRKYKCADETCPWHKIGFLRKLEAQKHYVRKHGVPEFECRFWSAEGEKFPGCGVCNTRWHADSGNRSRHEHAIHSKGLEMLEAQKANIRSRSSR